MDRYRRITKQGYNNLPKIVYETWIMEPTKSMSCACVTLFATNFHGVAFVD